MSEHREVHYPEYLQIHKILGAQLRESEVRGAPAHDEMLFIITHQTFELWFKQILFELESIVDMFKEPYIPENNVALAVKRLGRVNKIFELIIGHFDVLETMTSLEFMDFRDMLHPASGFQSAQFRLLETTLGLPPSQRVNRAFRQSLSAEEQKTLEETAAKPTLLAVIQTWLEKMPFMEMDQYSFWEEYKQTIQSAFSKDRDDAERNTVFGAEERQSRLAEIQMSEDQFMAFFNAEEYNSLLEQGHRKLSQRSTLAAIFIFLYSDYPLLNNPFQLLNAIISLDNNFALWRYRHMLMTNRMIGSRIGTGGSSGAGYLLQTALKQRVFSDFVNIAGMLTPRQTIPNLPDAVRKKLDFYVHHQ